MVDIHTGGSCLNNGQPEASAGYGVFFDEGDPRNIAGRVNHPKQTSNVGELAAVCVAIDKIYSQPPEQQYTVLMGSSYAYNCLTTWHYEWAHNGWLSAEGFPVKYQYLLRHILDKLEFLKVSGYTVDLELYTLRNRDCHGNRQALALAESGSNGQGRYVFDPATCIQTFKEPT